MNADEYGRTREQRRTAADHLAARLADGGNESAIAWHLAAYRAARAADVQAQLDRFGEVLNP